MDSTQGRGSTSDYDKATLEYLVALNRIFETGLLSQKPVSDLDSSPLMNVEAGFKFFEEWCEESLTSGMVIHVVLKFHMSTFAHDMQVVTFWMTSKPHFLPGRYSWCIDHVLIYCLLGSTELGVGFLYSC